MSVLRTTLAVAIVATLCLLSTASIVASEDLTRARDLYHAAAYDDALMVLSGIVTFRRAWRTDAPPVRPLRRVSQRHRDLQAA